MPIGQQSERTSRISRAFNPCGYGKPLGLGVQRPHSVTLASMVKTKMGVCKYCGQRAGFLRSDHRECHEKHDAGWNEMVELVAKAAETGSGIDTLQTHLTQVASASYIPEGQIRDTLVSGWQRAVDRVLAHGVISEPVESSLSEFAKTFRFSDGELDAGAARTQLVKGVVLRELLSGKVPQSHNCARSTALQPCEVRNPGLDVSELQLL
jgi:hypothetical protein